MSGCPMFPHCASAVANLTFSRRGPVLLMVERLGHKVAEKWQRSQQSGQADALLRGTMLRWRKTCQTTVRLRVSTVELLKDTGEQHLVRVAAGERHPDVAYG